MGLANSTQVYVTSYFGSYSAIEVWVKSSLEGSALSFLGLKVSSASALSMLPLEVSVKTLGLRSPP